MSDPTLNPPAAVPEVSHILVVEDLDALRALVIRVLTTEGYQVVGVSTAPAAFAVCTDERFALLITDHAVPGGDGTEIARRATGANRRLKVLFMSGSPASSLDLTVPGIRPEFLSKPFEIDELVTRVRQLLSDG